MFISYLKVLSKIIGGEKNACLQGITLVTTNADYIELYYENGYFYAIKHSCGLTSQYMSNSISNVLNANTYLSLLYCNGRIDIYASNYE